MRRASIAAGAFACAIGLLLVGPRTSVSQAPAAEFQLKGTFLYNFAQFVQWPSHAFPEPDAPFRICVAGDPFGAELDKIIAGENLGGRRMTARRLVPGDNAAGCQILYVSPREAARSLELIKAAANKPILTVGEAENFIDLGGMIRFTIVAHRVRFEINPDAAEQASLRVSSRLLRVADIAHPRRGVAP